MCIKDKEAPPYNNRGYAKYLLGRYDDAIEDYTRAIEINPRFIQARINRALAYNKRGCVDAAMVDYNTIKIEHPDLTRAINSISLSS